MQNKEKIKELVRAAKFTLISISAGLIDAGSFAIMNLLGVPILFAQPISLLLSVVWNFTINRKVTFKSASNIKIAMLMVLGLTNIKLLILILCMNILIKKLLICLIEPLCLDNRDLLQKNGRNIFGKYYTT